MEERAKLEIPFEEVERIYVCEVDKAMAAKKHKRNQKVKLAFKVADRSFEIFLYKEDYEEGDCFREKAMFHFYTYMLLQYDVTEWREVLYKALQCMRACPKVFTEDYISYHNVAKRCYYINGDERRARRHLYCQLMQKAVIADEEYLMDLIEQNRNKQDQHRTLLFAIFFYALLSNKAENNEDCGWTRERYALIEMALKEATEYYAENEECNPLQRAFIYLCRGIYYGKTRRPKLVEVADKRLMELLETLEPQGVNADNFSDIAVSTIWNEIEEILIYPFSIAVENVFADMLCDEEEETEEGDEDIDEEETISPDMLERCMEKAEEGDDVSQYILGRCYYYGEGVEQDFNQAVFWWTKAANQGHADAMTLLGLAYRFGLGVEVDYAKSLSLLQEAADKDCASALMNLGVCYQEGWGVEVDIEEALRLYMMAAERGDVMALFNIGLYHHTEEDYEKAIYWYRLAADKEDPLAMSNLGYCYENGLGIEANQEEAARLYRASAELGHDCAQYNLAECYEQGKGVEKDLVQAIHWYTLSAEQGYENAIEALERLKKE